MPNKGAAHHLHALYESGQRARMLDAWRDHAACAGRSAVMEADATRDHARRICRTCPVNAQCLRWVLSLPVAEAPDGIVAGLTVNQRGGYKAAASAQQKEMST